MRVFLIKQIKILNKIERKTSKSKKKANNHKLYTENAICRDPNVDKNSKETFRK